MELLIEKLLGFFLVLTRTSAFFLVIPVFGWKTIPMQVKVGMAVLVSVFFSMVTGLPFDARKVSALQAGLLIVNESLYGLALGLIATIVFTAVKVGGEIIEQEMGLTMAEILDPLTGESAQPLSSLLEMIFILLFLSANGHHLLLLTLSRSYESFPLGSVPDIASLTGGLIGAGSAVLIAGLQIAAPLLAASLLLMVVLAVLARVVPEMDILFTSFPLRVGLGLFMTAALLPLISKFVSEFSRLMGELVPM